MESKNKCYNCAYRGSIPGDAHSSCNNPLIKGEDRIKISMLSLHDPSYFNKILQMNFNFQVSHHAIMSGYFCFPSNFDPVWIEGDCSKHSSIISKTLKFKQKVEDLHAPYLSLLVDIENGKKTKEDYKDVIDKYEYCFKIEKDKKDDEKMAEFLNRAEQAFNFFQEKIEKERA